MTSREEIRKIIADEISEQDKITLCLLAIEAMRYMPITLAEVVGRTLLPKDYLNFEDMMRMIPLERAINPKFEAVERRYKERN